MSQQTPYTDIATCKAFLNIDSGDTSQDAFLSAIIPMAQTFIERYTGRTFGWGDVSSEGEPLDDPLTDYSNTDNIGISSYTLSGTNLTITTMGPHPWQVGANISVYGIGDSNLNGVWQVTARPSATQLIVDTSVQTGTQSASDSAAIPATGSNFAGYIGNAVSNYRYITQESQDGIVGSEVWLRNMDIRSVESVYIGQRNLAQPVLLDHTQYVWRDDGRLFLGGAYFNSYDSSAYGGGNGGDFYGTLAAGFQTIMVSYYCGYIGVPPDVTLAATDLVLSYYTLRKGMGIQMERIGDYQVQYDITFRKMLQSQPDSLNTLNMYRRRHI